ncbi:hypothetical protein [Streptomyces sp. NPDC006510]|uniref:hypothetical protein n=1 Tax=Streptomyces sp. NPDC006510 TaxID=3155600 RepID=UPI0033BCC9AB
MTGAPDYSQGIDSERALKFAVQRIRGDRAQIIEGIIEPVTPTWDHERAARGSSVDRIEGSATLFSAPGHLGYTHVDGPRPFGAVLRLPHPFDLDLDTSGLSPV